MIYNVVLSLVFSSFTMYTNVLYVFKEILFNNICFNYVCCVYSLYTYDTVFRNNNYIFIKNV